MSIKLDWKGPAVKKKMDAAAKAALAEIGTKIADDTRENTPRDTGKAQSVVGRTEPQRGHAGGWLLYVGQTKGYQHHFLILELRQKMLRNAFDKYAPQLRKAIKDKFARVT